MAAKVVDASAVAAILFAEPEGAAVAAQIEDDRLFAPTLLPFEIANVCVKKIRRHPSLHQPIMARLSLFSQFPIETMDIDCDAVVRLADETMLSAYDASYLWLARVLAADLVTLDQRLARVAGG